MKKIAVLLACYNRKSLTLNALRNLSRLGELSKDHEFQVFLLDDASTDGTADAVRVEFPATNIIEGTGQLYWNLGMIAAYRAAQAAGRWDTYLMMNDDLDFEPITVIGMLEAFEQQNKLEPTIMVGGVNSMDGKLIYSGFRRKSHFRPFAVTLVSPLPGELIEVDTLSGNFVLVPELAMSRLNGLDPAYLHYYSDLDFGYRARQKDFRIVLYSKIVGVSSRNTKRVDALSNSDFRRRMLIAFGKPDGVRQYMWFMWQHGCRPLLPIYFAGTVTKRLLSAATGRA